MKKIIFDCDNTIGVENCDVDDGLTLLYLLGCKDVEILGITNCFGNNETETVYANTLSFLKEIGRSDIKVYKGGLTAEDYENEATDFILDTLNKEEEVHILATGSLTNIAGALVKDEAAFNKVKSITLMGGITSPLVVGGLTINELNFSVDYEATFKVLTSGVPISIATGNNCLKVIFEVEKFKENLLSFGTEIGKYIVDKTNYWFERNEKKYGIKAFCNWDVTAGSYLVSPNNFTDDRAYYKLSKEDLKTGFLRKSEEGDYNSVLNLPQITDEEGFVKEVYRGFEEADIKL